MNAGRKRALLLVASALALVGCGGGGGAAGGSGVPAAPSTPPPTLREVAGAHGIDHIVVIVQENRTFDNLFHGFPGANYATKGRTSSGKMVP